MKLFITLITSLFIFTNLALAEKSTAPNSRIKDLNGKTVQFHSVLEKSPSVVIFYRGGWCPYCNVHLKDLRKVEKELKGLGVQIIAISPDKPSELKESLDKNKLGYKLFSDQDMILAKDLGISFTVDESTLEKYKGYGIDLEKASDRKHHMLPVPSVFLIDTQKKILFKHSDENYKVRLKSEKILDLAKKHFQKLKP